MTKRKTPKHNYGIPYVHPFSLHDQDVCTVGQLKKMLEMLDDDIIVLVGDEENGWWNNISSAIFPDHDGMTCLSFVEGEPYDTRFPNPFPFEEDFQEGEATETPTTESEQ